MNFILWRRNYRGAAALLLAIGISLFASGRAFAQFNDNDSDGLADAWETAYNLSTNNASGAQGAAGNSDNDIIPSAATTYATAWPISHGGTFGPYNDGPKFNNILEFAGLDGAWSSNITCAATNNARGDDPKTDPTVADTDGDGMPDGWEYYFWRWRGAGAVSSPSPGATNITGSAFDPCKTGDPAGDADGDGLSNIAEFNAGTDPTDFDTDRDGMDDFYEVSHGLNPLDPSDATANNDDDAMAEEVIIRTIAGVTTTTTLYHAQVYLVGAPSMEAGDTAFDPRTAWFGGSIAHPNTVAYTALDEYLGADRIPRVQANADRIVTNALASSDATDPRTADTDGDGMQDGWENYVGLNPNTVTDSGGDQDNDGVGDSLEWANTTADSNNNAGALGTWTNKLWPTDPGVLARTFAWQNVWFDLNGNGVYDAGEPQRFLGGVYPGNTNYLGGHSAGWTTPNGTLGRVNPMVPSEVNGITDRPIMRDTNTFLNVWVDGPLGVDGVFDVGDIVVDGAPTLGTIGTQNGLLFYHNDPHAGDTDWDGLPDSTVLGGGEKGKNSNPTSDDTDGDFLPDGWEAYAYANSVPANEGILVSDKLADYDGDGLPNNLEYWSGTVYEWMHIDPHWRDFPGRIVTRRPARWDLGGDGVGATLRSDMPFILPPDFATDPSFNISRNQRADSARDYRYYHTTRVDDADTDADGMDDYWEVYHGLNPTKGIRDLMVDPDPNSNGTRLLGTGPVVAVPDATPPPNTSGVFRIGITNDFGSCSNLIASIGLGQVSQQIGPFNFGLELMDPDQDGLANFSEYSFENNITDNTGRVFYHTDPTPWLRTDREPDANGRSFTADNYSFDNLGSRGPGFLLALGWSDDSGSPFRFETVEGFDSDNDVHGDKSEITASTDNSAGKSDPLDGLDPIRNRAALLRSSSQDFLREQDPWLGAIANQFTRYTVEAWVRPTTLSNGMQIVVDRAHPFTFQVGLALVDKNLSNYRLAITNSRPFVQYNDNAGNVFAAVASNVYALATNQWTHLAGTYDGTNLNLYVNGVLARGTPSAAVPVNGWLDGVAVIPGSTMIGARDATNTVAEQIFDGVEFGVAVGTNFVIGATNFYDGYLDEIRVWNGFRTQSEIQNAMRSKLSRTATGANSVLENYYTFDDCPDVDVHWTNNGVAVANEPMVPPNLDGLQGPDLPLHRSIFEWLSMVQHSTVYSGSTNVPYNYIVYAEDSVAHTAVVPPTDDILHAPGGILPSAYNNSVNPYERRANITHSSIDRPNLDLLFLNGAQADGDVFASDSWLPGVGPDPDAGDADGDGLPDVWETAHGLNPNDATGDNGRDGDPDGDGLSNYYEFLAGTDPFSTDSNGDGVPDQDEDFDGDGLSNLAEQNAGTLPNLADTDDDGLGDGEEMTGIDNFGSFVSVAVPVGTTDPLNSQDPPILRSMQLNGDGRVVLPPQNKFMSSSFTVEAWVNPTNSANGVVVSRYVRDIAAGGEGVNYEIGVRAGGPPGSVLPYVRYALKNGTEVFLSVTNGIHVGCFSGIPVGQWSYIAGVYDKSNATIKLFINGQLATYRADASPVPPTVFGQSLDHLGDEVTIGALRSTGSIVNGFQGYIDEFKFYRRARSSSDIATTFNSPPTFAGGFAPYTLRLKSRYVTPEPGMSTDLASMPPSKQVHAIVQFNGSSTNNLTALHNAGLTVLYLASPRAYVVTGSRQQIGTVSGSRASLTLQPSDKISPLLGASGVQAGRSALVQFYQGTTVSNALKAVQFAGATTIGPGYVASTYLVVQANDDQLHALAASDAVVWIAPASSSLANGHAARLFDGDVAGLHSAPFALFGEGWDGPGLGSADLTFILNNGTPDIANEQQVVAEALNKWAQYAALTFTPVNVAGLSKEIECTWIPIDGPLGILAFTFFPGDLNPEPIAGDAFFDDGDNWTTDKNTEFDLRQVALHEFGHALGLDHSDDPTSIMYPFYGDGKDPELTADDIAGIQSLYAKPDRADAEFRFDDGGVTVEDSTETKDWLKGYAHAGVTNLAFFSTNSVAPLDADSDGDGMPNWWETAYGFDVNSASDAHADPDGDGLVNVNEFRAGTNPHSADSNRNGTDDGAEDSDGDSLSNLAEQNLYNSNPGLLDTDDDSLQDNSEVAVEEDPNSSINPFIPKALFFGTANSTGVVTVSDRVLGLSTERFGLTNWTVECLVRPTVAPTNAVGTHNALISRRETCTGGINFEMGLLTKAGGVIVPYVRYNDFGGTNIEEVAGGAQVPLNAWTHLAGRFANDALTLFVNGAPVASDNTLFAPTIGAGDLTFGSAGLRGYLKEIRIWKLGRQNSDINRFKDRTLFYDTSAAAPGYLHVNGDAGHLRENSTAVDPVTGLAVDDLSLWTLECWVRTSDTDGGTLISRWNISTPENADDFNYFLGVRPDGKLIGRFAAVWVEVKDAGKSNETSTTVTDFGVNDMVSALPINDGKWHHVAYDRDETNATLYIDGVVDTRQATFLIVTPGPNTIVTAFGVRSLPGPVVIGKDLSGDLDEVRTWNRGLGPTELHQVSTNNLFGDEPGLISYFNFDYQIGANADERAQVRDPVTEFGRYIPTASRVSTGDGPPIHINPLNVYAGTALAGYFSADDGGFSVEDFMHAGNTNYAGIRYGDVVFTVLSGALIPFQGDSDGDGLPDAWETQHGLDPGSALGDNGAWGDPDHDGLNNLGELQAGTDPNNYDSNNDGFSDYDSTNALGQTFGELYSDGDNMDDAWEAQYPGVLSPQKYDAADDPDSDGWSNFAEFMYNGPSTNGTVCRTDPTNPNSHPTPNIGFLIKYHGQRRTGLLRIVAYSNPAMNVNPSAELDLPSPSFGDVMSVTASQFTSGYLREGNNWFFAWWDNDGNGSWSDGEPAGIGQAQPYKLSSGDLTNVVIALTDTLPGYARFTWGTSGASTTVTITRTTSSGAPVVLSRGMTGRSYFHEGDYQFAGAFGLDAGDSDIPGYKWFAGGTNGTFSFNWSAGLTQPLISSPNGAPLIYAQNALAWSMDDRSVNVRLQILAGSQSGAVVYDAAIPAPYKDADTLYRFTPPLYAGDKVLTNGTYFWRVQSSNPRKQSLFSDFASFTVNTTNIIPDVYSIVGSIYYFGKATKGDVIVQAFTSLNWGGVPSAQVTLVGTNAGAYRLTGLPAGTYYLLAFYDQNLNGKLDSFESYGFITDIANISCTSLPKPHVLPGNQVGQDIVIRDRDTNNDNVSDAFAYQYLSKQFIKADFDGDGIGDVAVYFPGTGTWYIRKSNPVSLLQTQFGWSAALPIPGDYDADGKRDIAVYDPATATWYLNRSTAGFQQQQFGWSAVTPVPGDYDGDGKRDIAVFDPVSGTWYILQSSTLSVVTHQFGFAGVTPVPGDFDGDGKADLAVYHQPTGNWYILLSASQTLRIQNFGWSAAQPVPCDYDGDGKTDLAVFNKSAGNWYISPSTGGMNIINWGWFQTRPVPADYDGDGVADIAVFNPGTGTWYIRQSSGGSATIPWGWDQTVPVSSDAGLINSRAP